MTLRVLDHDVRPGVEADMGEGDAWPGIRRKIAGADIHTSSVAQRVLERLDAGPQRRPPGEPAPHSAIPGGKTSPFE